MSSAGEADIATAKAWQKAFNKLDSPGMADNCNFPHVRLAQGKFTRFETRQDFLDSQMGLKDRLEAEGWVHTTMDSVKVVQEGPDKVHLAIVQLREHADGTVYKPFNTLWIITLQDGNWGIQFRSSYVT